MSWTIGNQHIGDIPDINAELAKVEGDLDDIQVKIWLAKFLRANLGFSIRMFFKMKTFLPVQEIILRSILARDSSLVVAARGLGKSTLISLLSIYMPIFYPGSKGVLISTNFRTSRRILEEAEKLIKRPGGELLKVCFPDGLEKGNIQFRLKASNGSDVIALPLSSGEGLRGTRATYVVIDEGLLISKDIQENVLRPFLTAKRNAEEEMLIKAREDELIRRGVITEADRMSFPKNKFIVFSSASYKFEYLYEMFTNYIESIMTPDPAEKDPPTFFAMRSSYKAIPENSTFLDLTQIKAAKAHGGENTDYFKKEYMAMFTDASSSYFNVRMMNECTVKAGEYPTTQVFGDKDVEYLLAIDPSYSASKDSDYFAMAVYMLVPQERKLILVHTYGRAGGDLKDHFEYLSYLLCHFNIVFAIIDDSGSEFTHGFNESMVAMERNLRLGYLDMDYEADNIQEELAKAKQQYNKLAGRILYGQRFASNYIRKMNEHLVNQINAAKVWFASGIQLNDAAQRKYSAFKLPYKFKDQNDRVYEGESGLYDFIRDQDQWVRETKAQVALIEVKATVTGILQYDLPTSLKRSESKNRVRKDHYTTLLLAVYGAKLYWDIMFKESKPTTNTFRPILI